MQGAVEVKHGLCWKFEGVRGVRAMGYLPRRAAYKEWDQPKREEDAEVSKTGKTEPSKLFDN